MADLNLDQTLRTIARAIPEEIRPKITIVGSVAAGQAIGRDSENIAVRTKDIDCIIAPLTSAVVDGPEVARTLIKLGWQPRIDESEFPKPWDDSKSEAELPVLRLYPPHTTEWFLEFLSVPESYEGPRTDYQRIIIDRDLHFVLPCFAYSPIAIYDSVETSLGIRIAQPAQMTFAHLLQHPIIGNARIRGTNHKRSNKDLGRAIALARLCDNELDTWPAKWMEALVSCLSEEHRHVALTVGAGLEQLLESGDDLQKAYEITTTGLLANLSVTRPQFEASGRRLLNEVVFDFLILLDSGA